MLFSQTTAKLHEYSQCLKKAENFLPQTIFQSQSFPCSVTYWKVIKSSILRYLRKCKLFNNKQYEFRQQMSSADLLLFFDTNQWHNSLENHWETPLLLCFWIANRCVSIFMFLMKVFSPRFCVWPYIFCLYINDFLSTFINRYEDDWNWITLSHTSKLMIEHILNYEQTVN